MGREAGDRDMSVENRGGGKGGDTHPRKSTVHKLKHKFTICTAIHRPKTRYVIR